MTPLSTLESAFVAAVVFAFGLIIGSFLNVVIYRLPAELSIVKPASRCPHCETPIAARDNVPVLGWLLLGGKCRACKAPISWRYPAIELATGWLFLATYMAFGLTWQTGLLLIFGALLVVTFWIDIDHMLILDEITLPGIAIGLAYSAFVTNQFWLAVAAALYGVAILMGINALALLFIGRDGVGGGDLTLIAMLGAWLGLAQGALALGLAMLFGALMGLALIFWRWAQERRWQPFAVAAGVGAATFAAFAYPLSLLGPIAPGMVGVLVGMAALMGASGGWMYMRLTTDEGEFTEIPFGPALVLGGLTSLFFGLPVIAWYTERML